MIKDGYMFDAENLLYNATAIGIKTFLRPSCALEVIRRYQHFIPGVRIYVADDSYRNISNPLKALANIKYIELPEDSGVGYGRNRLVEAISNDGYEFMILTDDDILPPSREELIRLVKYYFVTKADIIAGSRCDNGECKRNRGMIVQQHGYLHIYPDVTLYNGTNVETCHRTDIIQNIIFAKPAILLRKWDDYLKNNDHYDFLLTAKQNNLRLISCSDILFDHIKDQCQSKSPHSQHYQQLRTQRWKDLIPYVFKKWHLHSLDDEVGNTVTFNGTQHAIITWAPTKRVYVTSSNDTFVTEVLKVVNAKLDAWNWCRLIYEKRANHKSWLKVTRISSCAERVIGSLSVAYDRPTQYKIRTQLSVDIKLPKPTCDISHHFMQLIKNQIITNRFLSINYIVPLSGDNKVHVNRLLTLFQTMQSYEQSIGMNNTGRIVLVNMDSTIQLQEKRLQLQFPSLSISVIRTIDSRNRAIALKHGVEYIRNKTNYTDTIFFTTDTSLLFPKDFGLRIATHVICGVSGYAPIVAKCLNCQDKNPMEYPNSKLIWMKFEMNALGFCLSDYTSAGGYNDQWSAKWDAESIDIYDRILYNTSVLTINRIQEQDYYHSGMKNATLRYYENENVLNRTLPPSTLSSLMTNQKILQTLVTVLNKALHADISQEELIDVWQAYSPKQDAIYYTIMYKHVEQISVAIVQYKY